MKQERQNISTHRRSRVLSDKAAVSVLSCLTVFVFTSPLRAQTVMSYGGTGSVNVPSLYGTSTTNSYTNPFLTGGATATSGNTSPYLNNQKYPANTPASQSAATPVTTFGLPAPSATTQNQQTVFGPPPVSYRNESLPTTDHDPSARNGQANVLTTRTRAAGDYNLEEIEDARSGFYGRGTNSAQAGREQMLANQAYDLGERAGYSAEAVRLNRWIKGYAGLLDQKYDFDRLRNGFVMPPVIAEVDTTSEKCGFNCIYLTSGSYRIVTEAYVTDRSPSWRNYLFLDTPPLQPPSSVAVKGRDRSLWKRETRRGWNAGIIRARHGFESRLATLRRDYAGMLRYYQLEREGAVSMASVAIERKDGAIYVNGRAAAKGEMRIGLTIAPRFQNPQAVAASYAPSEDIP